jgi:hypothetical protein
MKRIVLAGLTLGASALVVPAGHAAAAHDTRGGCAYSAYEVTTQGDYRGVMYETSVTTEGGVGTAPIGATVSCWIVINGFEVPGTRHTYGDLAVAGIQAGADQISFTAQPQDDVVECHSVRYADGTTSPSWEDCPVEIGFPFPPQPLLDLLNQLERTAQGVVCSDDQGAVCAVLCPQLQGLAGDYGPVAITPDGDVVVVDQDNFNYNPVLDCPAVRGRDRWGGTMRRILLAGVMLGASALVAPASQAATAHDIRGGCGFDSVEVTTGGGYAGVIYDVSVTTVGGLGTAPIGATVSCWIAINGDAAPGTRHSYGDVGVPGIQAGADPISFTALRYDDVAECMSVVYADNTSTTDCPPIDPIQIPPQEILDLLNLIEHAAQSAVCSDGHDVVCALVCPQLQRLAGDYGPVTITADGDVVVVDQRAFEYNPVFDCPPYVSSTGGMRL